MFKKILVLCAFVFCIQTFADDGLPTPQKTTEQLDSIVAIVNKDLITQNELDSALKFTKQQIMQAGQPMPNAADLRNQVLQGLIDRQLQLQIAQQNNIQVSDADVDNQISAIAKRNNTNLAGLQTQLANTGLSYAQFRQRIREQMLIQQIQQSAAGGNIAVAASDISAYRAEHKGDTADTQYEVGDILLNINNIRDKAQMSQAHDNALAIMRAIKNGQSVDAVTQKYGATFTNLGWRKLSDLPTLFTKPVLSTEKGGVAGPVLAPNGYHVLQVINIQTADSNLTDDQIRQILMQQQFEKALKNWLQDLRHNAYIKIN